MLHVLRRRMEYPELKRAVREQCQAFGANVVLVEDKASGTQLIQELVQGGLHAVTRYQPQSDKIRRMHAQTAMIENGFVHLPKEASWLTEYLHEMMAFPRGRHHDQVPPGTSSRGRRPSCSTGSSEAAAPAPMPGSGSCTRSGMKPDRPPLRSRRNCRRYRRCCPISAGGETATAGKPQSPNPTACGSVSTSLRAV